MGGEEEGEEGRGKEGGGGGGEERGELFLTEPRKAASYEQVWVMEGPEDGSPGD